MKKFHKSRVLAESRQSPLFCLISEGQDWGPVLKILIQSLRSLKLSLKITHQQGRLRKLTVCSDLLMKKCCLHRLERLHRFLRDHERKVVLRFQRQTGWKKFEKFCKKNWWAKIRGFFVIIKKPQLVENFAKFKKNCEKKKIF